MSVDLLKLVRQKAEQKLLFSPHAVRQMARPDRMISTAEIRKAVFEGEIIEDYPNDARGHSCLLLGFGREGRAIHVVCAPKDDYAVIITAYSPSEHQWADNWKSRR